MLLEKIWYNILYNIAAYIKVNICTTSVFFSNFLIKTLMESISTPHGIFPLKSNFDESSIHTYLHIRTLGLDSFLKQMA